MLGVVALALIVIVAHGAWRHWMRPLTMQERSARALRRLNEE